MITLYHLTQSRSQRIVWLLEELDLEYDLQAFDRNPETGLAPDIFKTFHPLGKAPVLVDGEVTLAESGAIVEYLIDKYGQNRLKPNFATKAYYQYIQWLHYAEGSLMMALMVFRLAKEEVKERYALDNAMTHLSYLDQHLMHHHWLLGKDLTGADFMVSFPAQFVTAMMGDKFPNIARYAEQIASYPSYLKAIEKVGQLDFSQLKG
ncbi:glutathione S-transferase family protein [Pelistega ratti]|uniref:glutathione S-transferase family protein n=1 Tax=Pelistega ratti TaxID=2652177 RepID=UPI001356D501|nr:glutathione S-transferase family protein [Pelistega ratti]